MLRKYFEIEEEGFENGDIIDDFNLMVNEDEDDDDVDDVVDDGDDDDVDVEEEDDDDYYDDDRGGFEGVWEVGFMVFLKGFKVEVNFCYFIYKFRWDIII